eukprot:Blabericola_migrator_1__2765@NODE_178_length_11905_cov_212_545362_g155_i0_p1_GENE_NODE_178_length_11905_cov_212_545362_g155_i0NODE_178_length_11905_cov_212_545362_g155_i0_p1_ORF_typecomplete_len1680_score241_37DUF1765/PF08578_10/3_3e03DUF1765/PF08578_10/1_8e19C2/PF00168_30/0_53C2/PF00168_30/5_1e03_NODE_178_length_11905_cov_212_545362_g155_i0683611875
MGKACTKPSTSIPAGADEVGDNAVPPSGESGKRRGSFWTRGGGTTPPPISSINKDVETTPSEVGLPTIVKAPGFGLRLQQLTSKTKQLQDLLALSTGEDDSSKRDLRPPHMIRDGRPRLASGFRFYVCIYGLRLKLHCLPNGVLPFIKRRSLPSKAFGETSSSAQCFVVLSWDDGWLVRRTDLVIPSGLCSAFTNAFLFYWYCDSLSDLAEKDVVLSVYYAHGGRQVTRIGETRINLLTIATGPLHHDMPIVPDTPGPKNKRSRIQLNIRMTQICEMLIAPIEMMVHVQTPAVTEPVELLSQPSQTISPPIQEGPLSVMRSKSVNQLGRSIRGLEDVVEVEESTPEPRADPDCEIEKAAAGGHSNEDGHCPIVAKWRVDFSPTGVVNPTIFPSGWTDLTSVPHWMALKLPHASKSPTGSLYASTISLPGGTSPSFQSAVNQDLRLTEVDDDFVSGGTMDVKRSMSHGVAASLVGPKTNAVSEIEIEQPTKQLKLVSAAEPLTGSNENSRSAMPSFNRQASTMKGMRLSVLVGRGQDGQSSSSRNPLTLSLDRPELPLQKAIVSDSETRPALMFSGEPLSDTKAQLEYRSLATHCRNGQAVSHYLDANVFPSCYLMTTGDTLRTFHLHFRVWSQPLGVGNPRLFGETWIPFFKLYESDIVDSSERHFYDAHFSETLWNEGRSVAKLEGIVIFQDSPLIRQMMAGVHTERGFSRIAMPVLGELTSSENARRSIPREILSLCQLQVDLSAAIFATSNVAATTTAQREASPQIDLRKTCEKILELLSKSSGAGDPTNHRSAFSYDDLSSLICGQRVLLDLATHILDMEDLVPWNVRGLYGHMLSALLKRAELDMGNLIPQPPDFCRRFPDVDVRELTRVARKAEGAKEKRELSSTHDIKSPASTRSSVRRLNVFTKLKPSGIPSVRRGKPSPRVDDADDLMNTTQTFPSLISNSSSRSTETKAVETIASGDVSASERSSNYERKDDSSLSDLERSATGLRTRNGHDESSAHCETPRLHTPKLDYRPQLRSAEIVDLVMYHKRMKLCKLYLTVLLRLRRYGLSKVCAEALFESQRRQLCSHLAVLLVRLPSFRDELLAHVLTPEERVAVVPGWRGQEFALDKESLDLHDRWVSKTFPGLYEIQVAFDWEPFHTSLIEYFGSNVHAKIEEYLEANFSYPNLDNWADQILRPRSIVFFTLLEAWIRAIWQTIQWQRRLPLLGSDLERQAYMRSNSSSVSIRWDLIPGYATMLKAFLIEIRTRPISKFPDALLNCSAALLANDRLLSVFMRMVLTRTSVFSREQVFAVLNYIDFWLEVLSVQNRPVPLTFDYRFLGRALETVVASDLALQMAKGLWFVYKRMDLLASPKMLQILLDLLMYRRFNDLILHWSWLVRKCFISLLLYRLSETARRIVARHSDVKATPHKPQPALTDSDRMILWAFILMSRNIAALGLVEIFPARFLEVNVRQILSQPDPVMTSGLSDVADIAPFPPTGSHLISGQAQQPLIWNVPRVLATVTVPPPIAEPQSTVSSIARLLDHKDATSVHSPPGCQPLSPTTHSHHLNFQRPVRVYRQGLKRIRRQRSQREESQSELEFRPTDISSQPHHWDSQPPLQPTTKPADPQLYLPPAIDLLPRHRPYVKCLVKEFATELEAYKVWVISGTTEVPPMHIPASPLDTNVDVPLEDD